MQKQPNKWARLYDILPADSFTRDDDSDDALFYQRPRLVQHLDSRARQTVSRVIGTLVTEREPELLDLMSSWTSHLPSWMTPRRLAGVGMNDEELRRNDALTEYVVHDLNADPRLPFADESFDAVINTVSIDYLVDPIAVLEDVARVLRPGGLLLVMFSDRMFRPKATKIWRDSSEAERLWLVEDFFRATGEYEDPQTFSSQGHARPENDPYFDQGIPSDPIFTVYADRKGGPEDGPPRPELTDENPAALPPEDLERRKRQIKDTLRCPYCQDKLDRFDIPENPFTEWDNDFVYVCFNNGCAYLLGGWSAMARQGNHGFSYRLMYDPIRDTCHPTPIASPYARRKNNVSPRG